MTTEERMELMMKSGVTLRESCCWTFSGSGLKMVLTRPEAVRPDGRVHRVMAKIPSNVKLATSNDTANSRDKNVPSPTNLQFTVHLKRNCLVSSNERAK